MKRYFLLWIIMTVAFYSNAQEGSFDSSFSYNGWTAFDAIAPLSSSDYEGSYKTLRQNDGKLIVVFQEGSYAKLARYNADGSLDKLYGIEGFSAGALLYPSDAAFQSDGKIVVVGQVWNGPTYYDLAATRFNTDGSVDTSFGTKGTFTQDFFADWDIAKGVAIQGDGKILIAGIEYNATSYYDIAVVRLNVNGTLDNSFGTAGIVTTDFALDNDEANSIWLLSDGKFIVGGDSYNSGTRNDFALVKYNADGSLDNSFGVGGKAMIDIGGDDDYINSIAIQGDGKIVAAGMSYSSTTDWDFGLARFNSNGTVDNSFGVSGKITTDFEGRYDAAFSVAIQGADTILLGGQAMNSGNYFDMALARYTPGGILDNNFGTGGKLITDFFGLDDQGNSVIIQPDGKIVFGGSTYTDNNSDIAIVRYTNSGSLDATFNATGKMNSFFPEGTHSYAYDADVQADGKIVVGGTAYNFTSDNYDFYVARFNADGSPDTNFGQGGIATTDFSSNTDRAYAVKIQSDGKIILVGVTNSMSDYNYNVALARYNSNGTLDNTFGTAGKVVTDLSGDDAGYSVAILATGQILVAGTTYNESNYDYDFLLLRYNSVGILDNSFGSGGIVKTDINGGGDYGSYVTIQNDGKILMAGQAYGTGSHDFAMVRYSSTGVPDNTFGTAGKVTTDFDGSDDAAYRIAIQPDGKIILAGYAYFNTTSDDIALARYTSTGVLDNTFGSSGKLSFDLAGDYDQAAAVIVQPDGKILVGGSGYNGYNTEFILLRYSSAGTVDNSFGTGGREFCDFFGYDNQMSSAMLVGNRLFTTGVMAQVYNDYSLVAVYKISPPPSGNPLISINDVTVNENAGTATLTVNLDRPAAVATTINFATDDSTAASKGRSPDYKALKGSITIAKGATSAPISIGIKTDNQNENNEYFKVVLSLNRKMAGVAAFTDSVGVVTIVNVSGLSEERTVSINPDTKLANQGVKAIVRPNPSSGYFTLHLQSESSAPVNLVVTDASGRIVETKTVSPNVDIQIGNNYRPGVYYAQLVQNNQKLMLKLLKQSQ